MKIDYYMYFIFSIKTITTTCTSFQVLLEQGLGKYCDPGFVHCTQLEMQEALEMTQEEMDLAAHELMLQERFLRNNQSRSTSQKSYKKDNHVL